MNRTQAAKQEMERALEDLDISEELVKKATNLLAEAVGNMHRAKLRVSNAGEVLSDIVN